MIIDNDKVLKDQVYLFSLEGACVATYRFWYKTRINGASASMVDAPGISQSILKILDKARRIK